MTAHDLYEIVVGEIGRASSEFLYELKAWQLQAVIKGYYRRSRDMWSAVRWQTYNLMCVSMADLKKAGIYRPTDLIKFPWDKDDTQMGNLPTKSEMEEMQREMREMNATIAASKEPGKASQLQQPDK